MSEDEKMKIAKLNEILGYLNVANWTMGQVTKISSDHRLNLDSNALELIQKMRGTISELEDILAIQKRLVRPNPQMKVLIGDPREVRY